MGGASCVHSSESGVSSAVLRDNQARSGCVWRVDPKGVGVRSLGGEIFIGATHMYCPYPTLS